MKLCQKMGLYFMVEIYVGLEILILLLNQKLNGTYHLETLPNVEVIRNILVLGGDQMDVANIIVRNDNNTQLFVSHYPLIIGHLAVLCFMDMFIVDQMIKAQKNSILIGTI